MRVARRYLSEPARQSDAATASAVHRVAPFEGAARSQPRRATRTSFSRRRRPGATRPETAAALGQWTRDAEAGARRACRATRPAHGRLTRQGENKETKSTPTRGYLSGAPPRRDCTPAAHCPASVPAAWAPRRVIFLPAALPLCLPRRLQAAPGRARVSVAHLAYPPPLPTDIHTG